MLGELQGVGDQIVQDLPHPRGVAQIGPLGRLFDSQVEGQTLLARHAAEGGMGAARQLADVERRFFQLKPRGLDLGQVQHVVEDGQQGLARLADHPQSFALDVRQLRRGHDLSHAQHAVQGRANLVAHGGQEGALGQVGRLGLILGPHQGLFGQLAVGDVLQRADQPVRLAVFVQL